MTSDQCYVLFLKLFPMKDQDLKFTGPCARILSLVQQLVQLYHKLRRPSQMGFYPDLKFEELKKRETSWRF